MLNRLFPASLKGQEFTWQNKKREGFYAFLFIAPSLLGVGIFTAAPFADVLRRSFYGGISGEFLGLGNYISVLQNDAFRLAVLNTLKFTAVCIPVLMALSLLLSVMINLCKQGAELFKTTMLIPMALPSASAAFLWKAAFHKNGIVNSLLLFMGGKALDFMNTGMAFYIMVVCYIWKNAGYDMVLWTASLSNIPPSLYEASTVDGAGRARQFFSITLPELRQDFFIIGILSLINSFKVFREAYLVGGKYPHTSMYMLQHLFNNWFDSLDMDKLCAGAVIMAGIIFTLVILMKRVLEKER